MMRKYLTLGALSSGLALSIITVRAAEPLSSGSPGSAAGAEAAAIAAADFNRPARAITVPPSGSPILLEAGKGTLIRLPRPASTVFVANPETADVQIKSPSLIYVTAKAPGQTSLYAVDAEDRMLLNAPVRVEHDLSRVRQTLGAVAPGENVSVSSVDNALVLSGNVSSAGRAERVRSLAAAIARETKGDVVNRMSVATPNQVSIRIKVAEVNRQVLKTLGVNWNKLAGDHIRFFTNNPTAVAGNLAGQLAIGFGAASWFTAATVDALAQEGLVNLLAEPNLTATNGQPASFLAGGEFPVPVASASQGGVTTVTIEFKKFGVSLDVTPTIVDADHLSLRVRSEVSQIDRANGVVSQQITIPGLTVRRAETTVELGSGQSFMLAGLLQPAWRRRSTGCARRTTSRSLFTAACIGRACLLPRRGRLTPEAAP
jgi:pilus assembly protein CpaC